MIENQSTIGCKWINHIINIEAKYTVESIWIINCSFMFLFNFLIRFSKGSVEKWIELCYGINNFN